ncbi:unnamed protein product, partial [Polarella glacialis]
AGSEVVRSRDAAVLEHLDIVVDVGGIYDTSKLRFDHHQRGFFETVDGEPGKATCPQEATGRWRTKLSASGLVYKHFGREVIAQLLGTNAEQTKLIWEEVYERLLEAVDGVDNGVEISDGPPRYKDQSDLASRVHRLNPRWNEASNDDDQNRRFEQASSLCGSEFLDVLGEIAEAWLPAREKVKDSLEGRNKVHPSGQLLMLESGGLPWKEHLYALEREVGIAGHVKFVLYTDQAGMWRVQAVTAEGSLFTNRLSLPEPWCGVRDEALVSISGIPGCTFVHANGFIGGNSTYEGALAMAAKTLEAVAA